MLATAAGAPFLPKLVEGAKGNVAFGVGLMVLLILLPTAKRLARHMPTAAPE